MILARVARPELTGYLAQPMLEQMGRRQGGIGEAAVLAVAALVAACGDEATPAPSGCPGHQPTLEQCFVGEFFAECGGNGEARLACNDANDCRWFTGGCVAQGYAPSDCPPSDGCCHQSSVLLGGGPWPYPDDAHCPTGIPPEMALFGGIWSYGRLAWDRSRAMVVPTTIVPGLQPAAFACESSDPDYDPFWCYGAAFSWSGHARLRDTLFIRIPPNTGHQCFWIEVDLAAPAGPVARACLAQFTDALRCSCPDYADVACAVSGSLILSTVPTSDADLAGLRFEIQATLANGLILSGGLTLP